MLPHFIGIGVPKAGTTSLHHYLREHPQVAMSVDKEPHYFCHPDGPVHYEGPGDDVSTRTSVYDLADYQALFSHGRGLLRGEISPQYLADPAVPRRIKAKLPDAKFIVMLRDPAERAFSNFIHMRRVGREPEERFEAALKKEDARLAAGWEPFWGYRRQSQYGTNFGPWLDVFPVERFLVLTLRDLSRDTAATMDRVHAFLGLEPFQADHVVHNPGGVGRIEPIHRRLIRKNPLGGVTRFLLPAGARSRLHKAIRRWNSTFPTIKPSTYARLQHEFLPEIERVEALFGLDLDFWKHPRDR